MTTGADRPLRILVIEDEAIVAMLIGDVIECIGHVVAGIADTMADAIQLASSEQPDLALCDIKLLGGDSGLDVAAALKPMNIPCIFISGNCPAPEVGQGLAIGCVVKPFRPGAVGDAIRIAARVKAGQPPGAIPVGMMLY
ncbi:response regulator [Teichococcus wenyumeiae]|uniref:response regulator n=1 Tax=Teichococcus wenyumeiae TaxID=2478470 RepID=UPI0011C48635|nr:response regulator [Pseudoroseomonas wenyumeiae]